MQTQPPPRSQISGPAIAAMYAALLGLLTMAIVNIIMEASAPFKDAVFGIGKSWMPGAAGIGPYSGKETILLVVWLGPQARPAAQALGDRIPHRHWRRHDALLAADHRVPRRRLGWSHCHLAPQVRPPHRAWGAPCQVAPPLVLESRCHTPR